MDLVIFGFHLQARPADFESVIQPVGQTAHLFKLRVNVTALTQRQPKATATHSLG